MQPRRARHGMKAHRGRVPVRTGNSQRGNTVEFGRYGLRLMHGTRITAKTLHACLVAVKRSLKPIKGCRIWTRMFPDVPVTSKGVGMRMGRGKGSFDHWMFRAPKGKILFEIDGPPQAHEGGAARIAAKVAARERREAAKGNVKSAKDASMVSGGGAAGGKLSVPQLRPEAALAAMKLAMSRIPVRTEFVDKLVDEKKRQQQAEAEALALEKFRQAGPDAPRGVWRPTHPFHWLLK